MTTPGVADAGAIACYLLPLFRVRAVRDRSRTRWIVSPSRSMPFRLTDVIFWFSAVSCALAQTAILRSVIIAPARSQEAPTGSTRRRTMEIAWAVLPGIALVAVFVLTWRVMHGTHMPAALPASPGATQ